MDKNQIVIVISIRVIFSGACVFIVFLINFVRLVEPKVQLAQGVGIIYYTRSRLFLRPFGLMWNL